MGQPCRYSGSAFAEGNDKHIPVSGLQWVELDDGGNPMQSLLIVDDGHLHCLGEGVLAQGAFVAVVDAGFAINHVSIAPGSMALSRLAILREDTKAKSFCATISHRF